MEATYRIYKIKSEYKGDKSAPWVNNIDDNWNRHIVTVRNTETKRAIRFDFWGSIMEPELRSEYGLRNAFYCFVSDAISGKMKFPEFCSSFGYDEDSRTAEKTWKACKRAALKADKIIGGDICDFISKLQEVAG